MLTGEPVDMRTGLFLGEILLSKPSICYNYPMDIQRRKRISGHRAAWALAVVLAAGPVGPAAGGELTAEMKKDASRIQAELDRIKKKYEDGITGPMRSVAFTERELNSWLAVLLESNRDDALRELVLKLFDDNRIEGKAFVDLSGASLPLGLKPRMNIFFAAQVTVVDGAAKIDINKLFLEGQVIPIVLLDTIIAAASALRKSDARSIKDWVALPPGLKDLRGRQGSVVLYY
ncbi:MAG: hypothetical protein NTW38_03920 [Candidatus Aminicenantes bacterium]|nr:hypothetical protein [Candidatus Aminicenantes bacterium]